MLAELREPETTRGRGRLEAESHVEVGQGGLYFQMFVF
jgi:hypothetical protein